MRCVNSLFGVERSLFSSGNSLFPRRETDQVFVLNRGILSDIRPIPSDFWAKVAPLAGLGNRKSYPLPV